MSLLTGTRVFLAATAVILGALVLAVFFIWDPIEAVTQHLARISSNISARDWMPFALATSALTSLIAVATAFYLYRWRRILSGQQHFLVPEELVGQLGHLERRIGKWEQVLPALGDRLDAIRQESQELRKSFLTLQRSLDEKDEEIARLKVGYDRYVFRSYIKRFLKTDQAMADAVEEGEPLEGLKQSRRLLEDALEACGVKSFTPPIGQPYAESEGVADWPKRTAVADPEQDGLVLSVLESGYLLEREDGIEVIQPAKVEVGEYQQNQ